MEGERLTFHVILLSTNHLHITGLSINYENTCNVYEE